MRQQLEELAADLGSDVAFFVHGSLPGARGEVNGSNPAPFPKISGYVCSNLGLPFRRPARIAPMPHWRPIVKRGSETEDTEWGKLRNDLEPAVLPKYLFLPMMKDWLKKQSETLFALMSGSGSTMFAIVRSQDDGERLQDRFRTNSASRHGQRCVS